MDRSRLHSGELDGSLRRDVAAHIVSCGVIESLLFQRCVGAGLLAKVTKILLPASPGDTSTAIHRRPAPTPTTDGCADAKSHRPADGRCGRSAGRLGVPAAPPQTPPTPPAGARSERRESPAPSLGRRRGRIGRSRGTGDGAARPGAPGCSVCRGGAVPLPGPAAEEAGFA